MARICHVGREELRDARRGTRPRPRRQRVQPPGARGARASRAPACCPIYLDFARYREAPNPVLRRHARGRPHQPALRRPPRPEQAPGGPHPPRELLEALHLARRAPAARRASCRAAARYFDALQALAYEEGFTPGGGRLHRPRRARRAAGLLRGRARLRLDERARGLRRAARRVDADAGAGAGLRGDRGAVHARRRRRAVHARSASPRSPRSPTLLATDEAAARGGARRARTAAPRGVRAGGGRGRAAGATWSRCERRAAEVAFVVQRYGEDITGGSESLARAVAERLAGEHQITVFTTCARDYVTWRNELPEGRGRLGGVDVRRFPVEEERDLAAFNAFAEPLYARERTREEEIEFLRRQGPYVAAARRGARGRRRTASPPSSSSPISTTRPTGASGGARARRRSCPRPTTSRRCASGIYREVFARPRAFGFLTPAEEALVRSRFDARRAPVRPSRAWASTCPAAPDVAGFRTRHGLDAALRALRGPHRRRARAAPRCSPSTSATAASRAGGADLVLIGNLAMPEPRRRRRALPRLPVGGGEGGGHGGRRAVVCPSPYESLSIVLLEGFALGHARPRQRALAGAARSTACARTPASSTRTPTSTWRRSTCWRARTRLRDGPRRERPALRGGRVPLGRGARPLAGAAGAPPREAGSAARPR